MSRAVVGDDQAVGLHRLEDPAQRPGKPEMSLLALRRRRAPIGSAPARRPGAVRGGKDVAVGRAHRDAKGVADRIGCRTPRRSAPGPEGSPGPRRRRSSSPPDAARSSRAGTSRPSPPSICAAGPVQRVELVEDPVVAIDDQHVPVAVGVRIVAGQPALDPLLLRLRLVGDRIAGRTAGRGDVALVVVVERHRQERLRAGHDDVRHPVDRRRRSPLSPPKSGCMPRVAPM